MKPKPFASFAVGQVIEWRRTVSAADLDAFRSLSGDENPLHHDAAFARSLGFKDRVAYGALSMAFVSRLIGNDVPGPGAVWLSQNVRFEAPLYPGDAVLVRAKVKAKNEALRALTLELEVLKDAGGRAVAGEAVVAEAGAPAEGGRHAAGEALVTLPATAGEPPLEGVALVTGSSRGIGAATAEALAARGLKVAVNYRSDEKAAAVVVERLAKAGAEARAFRQDCGDPAGACALFEAVEKAFGRVDVLVHNAAPGVDAKPLGKMGAEDLRRQLSASVEAGLEFARRAAPGMKARGFGRLVFIGSSAAIGVPPTGWTAYVTAKAALLGLSRSLAVELGPDGITSNVVSPSLVPTDLWKGLTENQLRAMALRAPTRRLTLAEDVGRVVAFLAGAGGGQVNGAELPVTGGEAMR